MSTPFKDAATTPEKLAYYDALSTILGTDDDDEIRRFHNLLSTAMNAAGIQLAQRRYVQGLESQVRIQREQLRQLRELRNDLRAQISGGHAPR